MAKGGRRNSQKKRKNSKGNNEIDNENADEGARKCPHISRAVKLQNLQNKVPYTTLGQCLNCGELDSSEGMGVCICLCCAHQGCDRSSEEKHALLHNKSNPSHNIVVHLQNWVVWCYACDDEVPVEAESALHNCVKLLLKAMNLSPPPELEASLGSPSKTSDDTCKPKKDNLKNSGKLRTQIKRVKVAVLKSFGVTGGDDAKNLDDNERAQVKEYGACAEAPLIDSVFAGGLVSIVICRQCHQEFKVEETFLDLSLPLTAPQQESWNNMIFGKGGKQNLKSPKSSSSKDESANINDNDAESKAKTPSKHQRKSARKAERKKGKKGKGHGKTGKRKVSPEAVDNKQDRDGEEEKGESAGEEDDELEQMNVSDLDGSDNEQENKLNDNSNATEALENASGDRTVKRVSGNGIELTGDRLQDPIGQLQEKGTDCLQKEVKGKELDSCEGTSQEIQPKSLDVKNEISSGGRGTSNCENKEIISPQSNSELSQRNTEQITEFEPSPTNCVKQFSQAKRSDSKIEDQYSNNGLDVNQASDVSRSVLSSANEIIEGIDNLTLNASLEKGDEGFHTGGVSSNVSVACSFNSNDKLPLLVSCTENPSEDSTVQDEGRESLAMVGETLALAGSPPGDFSETVAASVSEEIASTSRATNIPSNEAEGDTVESKPIESITGPVKDDEGRTQSTENQRTATNISSNEAEGDTVESKPNESNVGPVENDEDCAQGCRQEIKITECESRATDISSNEAREDRVETKPDKSFTGPVENDQDSTQGCRQEIKSTESERSATNISKEAEDTVETKPNESGTGRALENDRNCAQEIEITGNERLCPDSATGFETKEAVDLTTKIENISDECESDSEEENERDSEANRTLTLQSAYHPSPGECSVMSCLSQFCASELLDGSNKFACEECSRRAQRLKNDKRSSAADKERNDDDKDDVSDDDECQGAKAAKNKASTQQTVYTVATKQLLISLAPPVLTLHLKRFQQARFTLRKLTKHVDFPLQLNLAPFCSRSGRSRADSEGQVLYSLYGVVQHNGNMNSGHYTAYVKVREAPAKGLYDRITSMNELTAFIANMWTAKTQAKQRNSRFRHELAADGQWFHVSDSSVSAVPETRVLKSQAYMLFYGRLPLSSR